MLFSFAFVSLISFDFQQIEDLKKKVQTQENAIRTEKKAVEDAKKAANAAQLASSRLETEVDAEKAVSADLRSLDA